MNMPPIRTAPDTAASLYRIDELLGHALMANNRWDAVSYQVSQASTLAALLAAEHPSAVPQVVPDLLALSLEDCIDQALREAMNWDFALLTEFSEMSRLYCMLTDLRRSGSACAMHQRQRGLTGKDAWAKARQAYGRLAHDGRWPATIEVVYGHAWKAAAKKTVDGRSIVRFDPKQRLR